MRLVLLAFLVFAGSCVHCLLIGKLREKILAGPEYGSQKDDEYGSKEVGGYGSQEDEIEKPFADKPIEKKGTGLVVNEKRGFRSFFYNYYDEMATAICAGIPSKGPGWILPIRRTCKGPLTCAQICNGTFLSGKNHGSKWMLQKKWACLESLHIYKSRPVLSDNTHSYTDSYKPGLLVYRYHSCKNTACGPNYCCCQYN